MKILAIKTDQPEAELYIYADGRQLAAIKWPAHLQLAETLNSKIEEILNLLNISYKDLEGIAVYKGPGSFTGLRIGLGVANSMSYGLGIPIVASQGQAWLKTAAAELSRGRNDRIAAPEYGAPPHITKPRR